MDEKRCAFANKVCAKLDFIRKGALSVIHSSKNEFLIIIFCNIAFIIWKNNWPNEIRRNKISTIFLNWINIYNSKIILVFLFLDFLFQTVKVIILHELWYTKEKLAFCILYIDNDLPIYGSIGVMHDKSISREFEY